MSGTGWRRRCATRYEGGTSPVRCGVAETWLPDLPETMKVSVQVGTRRACTMKSIRKEVIAMELQKWETPEFEEIGTSAEVTAYAGIWPDSE